MWYDAIMEGVVKDLNVDSGTLKVMIEALESQLADTRAYKINSKQIVVCTPKRASLLVVDEILHQFHVPSLGLRELWCRAEDIGAWECQCPRREPNMNYHHYMGRPRRIGG